MRPREKTKELTLEKKVLELFEKDQSSQAFRILRDLNEKDRNEKFLTWWENQNGEEKKMKGKAYEFEEIYFQDMTLNEYCEALTAVERDGELYVDDFSQDPLASIDNWRILIKKGMNSYGECNSKEQVILINEAGRHKNLTLLHEMIHAYEDMLSENAEVYQQYIILRLYKKLLPKIPDLMSLITMDCHRDLTVHSVLFLLKSLDLDLRLEKPLGTIYAYGRKRYFLPWKARNRNRRKRK